MQTAATPARERIKEVLKWCNDEELRSVADDLSMVVRDTLAGLKLGTVNPETTLPRALHQALSVYPHLPG